MMPKTLLRFGGSFNYCGFLLIILLSYNTVADSSNGPSIPQPSATTTSLSYTLSSSNSLETIIDDSSTSVIGLTITPTSYRPQHPFTYGTVATTSSVAAPLPSVTPPVVTINDSLVTSIPLPSITPTTPFFNMWEIISMTSAGGIFVLLLMLAFLVCCCLCCRKKKVRVPSVVELCDLSHYDDTFTKSCSLRSIPTYANTMSVATNEGHSHRLSSSDCSLGHAKPIDQQSPNTFKADVHTDSGESCQDATGPRHTIVKQASTSSIQVSEDLDWGTVPTLSRGKGLFSRK